MPYFIKCAALLLSAAALSSCGSVGDSYDTIDPVAELEPTKSKLELPPDLITSSTEAVVEQALTEETVVPDILGVTHHDDGQRRWLEVDAPAERVWPRLVEYWGRLGASLVNVDPKTGVMETDWVHHLSETERENKKKGIGVTNIIVNLLTSITDQETSLDKYTVRVERTDADTTLVFLSHRGSKKIQIGTSSIATSPKWEWVETEEDVDKVKIVLRSISFQLNPEQV